MKFIAISFLMLLLTPTLEGQNCNALEKARFFNALRFGEKIPDELVTFTSRTNPPSNYYQNFILQFDSLSIPLKRKYHEAFTFLSTSFSFLSIDENKKRNIFEIKAYSFFEKNSKSDSANYELPDRFTKLYHQFISLYGRPTEIEGANHSDSLFIKSLGMPRQVYWNCNDIILKLRIRYGSDNKNLNVLEISVKSRKYEEMPGEDVIDHL